MTKTGAGIARNHQLFVAKQRQKLERELSAREITRDISQSPEQVCVAINEIEKLKAKIRALV